MERDVRGMRGEDVEKGIKGEEGDQREGERLGRDEEMYSLMER